MRIDNILNCNLSLHLIMQMIWKYHRLQISVNILNIMQNAYTALSLIIIN